MPAIANAILLHPVRQVMGFVHRLKKILSSKIEEDETKQEEFHDPHHEKMTEEFVQRQQGVIDDAMSELESKVENVKAEPSPTTAPDYDAGEVEVADLLSTDEHIQDHSEMNVIEHQSVEEIGDHLESATIVGDLPEEVKF
jgi:hypothetical protein